MIRRRLKGEIKSKKGDYYDEWRSDDAKSEVGGGRKRENQGKKDLSLNYYYFFNVKHLCDFERVKLKFQIISGETNIEPNYPIYIIICHNKKYH